MLGNLTVIISELLLFQDPSTLVHCQIYLKGVKVCKISQEYIESMVCYAVVWCCMVLYGVAVVLHGVLWCSMVLHGVAWCCMVHVVWCCMVLYGVVWCAVVCYGVV